MNFWSIRCTFDAKNQINFETNYSLFGGKIGSNCVSISFQTYVFRLFTHKEISGIGSKRKSETFYRISLQKMRVKFIIRRETSRSSDLYLRANYALNAWPEAQCLCNFSFIIINNVFESENIFQNRRPKTTANNSNVFANPFHILSFDIRKKSIEKKLLIQL